MFYVKPFDPNFRAVSLGMASIISDYLTNLKTAHARTVDGEHWCQEAVMLTMIDGVATIGAAMGYDVEMLCNRLRENHRYRKAEMKGAAQGSLIIPEKLG